MIRGGTLSTDTITSRLSLVVGVSTNGSGLLSFVINSNPTSATEYASFATCFAEFRTLSYIVRWLPRFPAWGTSAAQALTVGPLVTGIQRNAALAAPTTQDAAWQNSSSQVRSVNQPFRIVVRATGSNEMQFLNTASPSGTSEVAFTAVGLTASTVYGDIYVEYLVQFRGRS